MAAALVPLVAEALALSVCLLAVRTDLRTRTIRNRLTYPVLWLAPPGHALVALALHAPPWPAFVQSCAGAAIALLGFGLPALLGALGWGDVKLMAAVGAILRWPLAFSALVYVLLAGGVIALGYALARGQLGATLRNLRQGRIRLPEAGAETARREIPYGLAILIGTAWAVLARHVPALGIV